MMKERIYAALRHPVTIPASVGVGAFAAGAAAGYFLAFAKMRELQDEIQEVVEDLDQSTADLERVKDHIQEIDDAKAKLVEHYTTIIDDYEYERQEEAKVEKGIVTNPRMDPRDIVVEHQPNIMYQEKPVLENVFADEEDDWDYKNELELRANLDPKVPYIIHRDEFFGEESGYSQSTLTYYAGDDILTDEQDVPIYNHGAIVGSLNFGHGSGDPNVVYIRNDFLTAEYEILKDSGSYEIEILGNQYEAEIEEDLRHSKSNFKFKEEM